MVSNLPFTVLEVIPESGNDTRVVAADDDVGRAEVCRVFPVCIARQLTMHDRTRQGRTGRVLRYVDYLDEDFILVELGHGVVLDFSTFFLWTASARPMLRAAAGLTVSC